MQHTSGSNNVGSAHSLRLLLVLFMISIDRRDVVFGDSSHLEGGVAGVGGCGLGGHDLCCVFEEYATSKRWLEQETSNGIQVMSCIELGDDINFRASRAQRRRRERGPSAFLQQLALAVSVMLRRPGESFIEHPSLFFDHNTHITSTISLVIPHFPLLWTIHLESANSYLSTSRSITLHSRHT